MQRKNKVLFVVTNHNELGNTGKKTGYFLREVSYPYKAITEAGYSIDFVSPKGGPAPMDPNSNDMGDEVNKAFTNDTEIMNRLQSTMSPDKTNPEDYDGIMYAGGHGTFTPVTSPQTTFSTPQCDDEIENTSFTKLQWLE